jgi:hypothetical protein
MHLISWTHPRGSETPLMPTKKLFTLSSCDYGLKPAYQVFSDALAGTKNRSIIVTFSREQISFAKKVGLFHNNYDIHMYSICYF